MNNKPPVNSTNDATTVDAKAVVNESELATVHIGTNTDNVPTKLISDDVATVITAHDDDATTLNTHDAVATELIDSDQSVLENSTGITGSITQSQTKTRTLNPLTNTFHDAFSIGGEAIKDRFIIKKILGQGGMGMVCQAVDLRKVEANDDQPHIAVKLLTGDFQQHPSAFQALQREAKKTQALAHPNIITVYDFDRDGDIVFMTMEELDGYPLDAIIKGNTDVVVDRKMALNIIRDIAQALEYAHSKGIVHSDLKPGNIFYTVTGQTKVLDFGIARALNNELYKDNFDAGDLNALTPKYASLEMFERQAPDPRDDIYALGLLAGELLCGSHPYGGKTAKEVYDQGIKPTRDKSVGFLYRRLINKAVAVDRFKRTQSAKAFLSGLSWAEKGPRRVCSVSVAVVFFLVANAFVIDAVDDEISLSALPAVVQQDVILNVSEAEMALKFQDYNGALVYLERVYKLHPSNDDVENHADKIIAVFKRNLKNTQGIEQRKFLVKQLTDIGNYGFMSVNENYMALRKEFK